jgi:tetratricopeptide (TPR) repeat protein
VAQTLENLVDLLKTRSKYSEAELLVREHLESLRSVVSADHSLIIDSFNQLAWLCWRQGKLEESIPLFEKVLEARQLALGSEHPLTLQTAANLGSNYRDAGRVAEAILKLEDAYRGMKQMEPSVGWQVRMQLLDVYNSDVGSLPSDRPQKIAELIQELLPITREKLPEKSLELAGQLAGFGLSLLRVKSYSAAESLIRESLNIRSERAAEAWTTFNTMSLLGGALLGQEKYTEAEPLLLAGYEGMKQRENSIPPPGKIRLPEALDRLISLYQATQNSEAEQRWVEEKELYESKASDL